MKLGAKIRQLRYKKDLKQVELAKLAGISNSYLSDIESGRVEPSLRVFTKLAILLEADRNWLLTDEPDESDEPDEPDEPDESGESSESGGLDDSEV